MHGVKKRLVAGAICFAGTAGVCALVLSLNAGEFERAPVAEKPPVVMDAPKPPPPKQKKQRPKRSKPRKSSNNSAPSPALGGSLSGLDLGLPGFAMGDVAEELLGEMQDVVMTEDSVDAIPRVVGLPAQPVYPPRARSKGLEGYVVLSLMVGSTGRIEDLKVVEAQPSGVFEEAAMAAVRQWSFEPATYEGVPVSVRVSQTLRFELDG